MGWARNSTLGDADAVLIAGLLTSRIGEVRPQLYSNSDQFTLSVPNWKFFLALESSTNLPVGVAFNVALEGGHIIS